MTNRSLTCNETYANELNEICTSELFDKELCIHNFATQWPRRIGLGVWGLVVLVFGGFGNLFTIVSLPYAARKQRQVSKRFDSSIFRSFKKYIWHCILINIFQIILFL